MWSEQKSARLIVNCFISYKAGNIVKCLTLTRKQTEKKKLEEALYNLSFENVYVLFVSFCGFHENFGLN